MFHFAPHLASEIEQALRGEPEGSLPEGTRDRQLLLEQSRRLLHAFEGLDARARCDGAHAARCADRSLPLPIGGIYEFEETGAWYFVS